MTYPGLQAPYPEDPGSSMTAISCLAHLTAHLHYPPGSIAQLLIAGHYSELVLALSLDNRLRGSARQVHLLDALLALSEDFCLPECYLTHPEALVRHVERIAG